MTPFTATIIANGRAAWTGLFLSTLFCCTSAVAQGSGRLYDPEPPMDSGYLRIIVAHPGGPVDIAVDGQSRVQKLAAQQPSDYLVIGEGLHTITLNTRAKGAAPISKAFTMERGKAVTLAFTSLHADASPFMFEDKGNTNKLKAILTAYNLSAKAGAIDVIAASGKTKVFGGLAYGTSASLQVNPITVDLMASPNDGKSADAKFRVEMTQGGTYSILLLPGDAGKLTARVIQNKTERYAGSNQ
ncbi:MAG: DUF4397 domain-containing protein [Sulfuriferula multivorans]|uniref:Alginate biosynthesis protein AlgF n=1 Tax=Sulfuriferula multivorans TaxID=1559896 RepID=A0A7C9K9X2_9PROT|nr:DUF4397 domain-containing protein [Sulfuriferula multivorans]